MAGETRTANFLMDQFARIGKGLSSPQRLRMLELLAQAERGVDEIAQACGLSIANASQHLQSLRRAGLAASRKEGLHVYYSLADPAVYELWRAMQRLGESRLAEVREFMSGEFDDGATRPPVTADELVAAVTAADITLVDVRPLAEYRHAHIPGALSLPLDEITGRFAAALQSGDVVVYCRGPYCLLGPRAVREFSRVGVPASRLTLSVPGWTSQGHPTERGDTAEDLE